MLLCNLLHLIIEKSMRIFLPLYKLHIKLAVFKIIILIKLLFYLVSNCLDFFMMNFTYNSSTGPNILFIISCSNNILKNINSLLLIWPMRILEWDFRLNSKLLLLMRSKKYVLGYFSFFVNVSSDLFELKSLVFI
jgi:hypothetical protein